jgi:hypothetical protein
MPLWEAALLEENQLLQAFEEIVVVANVLAPARGQGRDRIGAGCTADAEIDAAGKQRLQHVKTLRHVEWGMGSCSKTSLGVLDRPLSRVMTTLRINVRNQRYAASFSSRA